MTFAEIPLPLPWWDRHFDVLVLGIVGPAFATFLRWLSHREHKATSREIEHLHACIHGKGEDEQTH